MASSQPFPLGKDKDSKGDGCGPTLTWCMSSCRPSLACTRPFMHLHVHAQASTAMCMMLSLAYNSGRWEAIIGVDRATVCTCFCTW